MKIFSVVLLFLVVQFSMTGCSAAPADPAETVRCSWEHYKLAYIRGGRVVRPKNGGDTVSEGQAYAMLRAVLMDDRKTFDECLAWTESTLSRKATSGDRLLAWRFQDGRVTDSTAAADADIDYAYSLVLASRKWQDGRYLDLAREVLRSILALETAEFGGSRYLLPWPEKEAAAAELLPQNPSYYAPSHFRLFHEVSGDPRWLDLLDTGYRLLMGLQKSFGGVQGQGLVPDWCAVDREGNLRPLPGKSSLYGWEAARVPLRIAADYHLSGDKRALKVLRRFAGFFDSEFVLRGRILAEYACDGSVSNPYENPLFSSAAYAALDASGAPAAPAVLERFRRFIRQDENGCWYEDPKDYYVNSIAWLVEYYRLQQQ